MKSTSLWTRNYTFLFLSNFFLFFGVEMLSPVLPVYVALNGGSELQIGIIMSSFTISAVIIRFFITKITNCFSKRALLALGLLACAFAAFGYYLVSFFVLILMFRLLHGLGFGVATTLYGAMAANSVPEERIGEGMSFFGLGITVAAALGPFLGALVIKDPERKWIFLISSALIFAALVLTNLTSAGKEPVNNERTLSSKVALADFYERKSLLPSVLIMIFGASMAGVFTYIVLFGIEAGIEHVAVFFLINSLAEFAVRPFSGKIYDKHGHWPLLAPAAVMCAVGTVLLANSKGTGMIVFASVFYGIGTGIIFPVLEAWALRVAKPERRIAASATYYIALDLGIGAGSLLLGMIANIYDYKTMYLLSTFIFVLFLIVYLPFCIKDYKNKHIL